MTAAVVSPTFGISCRRPASARNRSSDSCTRPTARDARRNACTRYAGSPLRARSSAMRSRASTGFTSRPYSLTMGFYGEQVLPRIINKLGDTKAVREVRDETCEGLNGDVIEIGFGSGLNVPHFPSTVAGVWAVEPTETALKLAQNRVDASPIPV